MSVHTKQDDRAMVTVVCMLIKEQMQKLLFMFVSHHAVEKGYSMCAQNDREGLMYDLNIVK